MPEIIHPELEDLPRIEVPVAYALDHDRTLAPTTTAMERFYDRANAYGIDKQTVEDAKALLENDGGSFSPLYVVRNQLTTPEYNDFCEAYITERPGDPPMLYEDAPELLGELEEVPSVPHLVITYGVDPRWQELKIAAAGYQGYTRIMDRAEKGDEIASWRGPRGSYSFVGFDKAGTPVARYEADEVMLVDDKAAAFNGLPEDCTGAHLRRPNEARLKSQGGEVPPSVQTISSLSELAIKRSLEVISGQPRTLQIARFMPVSLLAAA